MTIIQGIRRRIGDCIVVSNKVISISEHATQQSGKKATNVHVLCSEYQSPTSARILAGIY